MTDVSYVHISNHFFSGERRKLRVLSTGTNQCQVQRNDTKHGVKAIKSINFSSRSSNTLTVPVRYVKSGYGDITNMPNKSIRTTVLNSMSNTPNKALVQNLDTPCSIILVLQNNIYQCELCVKVSHTNSKMIHAGIIGPLATLT